MGRGRAMRFKVPKQQPESFRASALYLAGEIKGLSPDRVEFVEVRNLFTDNARAASAVMDATASKSVRCKQPAYHFIVTFDPKDEAAGKITPELKRKIAGQVIERMGLSEHQLMVYSHKDTDHPHMHFLVNRIHPQKHIAYDRHQDGKRLTGIVKELAQEHELNILRNREYERQLGRDRDTSPSLTTDAEYWQARREGRNTRERFAEDEVSHMRSVLYNDFHGARSWQQLTDSLAARGYTLERKGQGLVLTDGEREAKLSDMGKGVRFNTLQERFGQTFDDYISERADHLQISKGERTPDASGMSPAERRTVDMMYDNDVSPHVRDEAAVRAADEADMEFRYWTQIEATYRSRQGAVRYAEHRERAMAKQEARDQAWLTRRDRSFMEGLATVYKDAAKARAKWDELEKTLGIGEAEEAVKKDPFLLGAVRGIRTGNVRTPEREKARRTFRYLVERRQKLRDSKRRVELMQNEIEIARRRTLQAVRDFEMIQNIAGTSKELQAKLMARIKARARALDRLTEKALKRSSLAEDRKQQLDRAYKQHRERQRELERARERERGLGL